MISAKVVADSIGPSGVRLTTMSLEYPRFIHAEFMTHRVFSRNASSSRAIPVKKLLERIKTDWARPLAFTQNKRGMQGDEIVEYETIKKAHRIWKDAMLSAVKHAQELSDLGVHKQHANRLVEPFSHISVVVTSTDWDNFFGLRIHQDAQPEIRALAETMYQEMKKSIPKTLKEGEWHLPFITDSELEENSVEPNWTKMIKKSVARCARVSYNNHEGKKPTLEEDLRLYERLLGSQPIHASPAEHQAQAVKVPYMRSGNLRGWIQFRKLLGEENIVSYTPGMFDEREKVK